MKVIKYLSYLIMFFILTIIIIYSPNKEFNESKSIYKVYLKGNELGAIKSEKELYNIINEKQSKIKKKYSVDEVLPPTTFNIVKTNSFNEDIISPEKLYKVIEKEESFTIKGYTYTIKDFDDEKEDIVINVLKKSTFEKAMLKFVVSLIDEEVLNDYLNKKQEKIETIGEYIEAIYFEEAISFKRNNISIEEKIYTNEDELIRDIMFGFDAKMEEYKVKIGDSIESISEEYVINTKEFLIANPEYKSDQTLLQVGDNVNVTIINPLVDMVVEVKKVEDIETKFMTTTNYDDTKPSNYSNITQVGINGITRTTQHYKIINGEHSSEALTSGENIIIRETVNQVVTKGNRYGGITGTYVDNGLDWGWPTNVPYIITSRFGSRWGGSWHNGVDISGTGYGSPIYAIADGVVTQARNSNSTSGIYIVVSHGNNYYSSYLHLSALKVKVGDRVKRGQNIASMGNTGWVIPAPSKRNPTAGTHLHLGFSKGEPYVTFDAQYMDPLRTIYR